ncbi:MAG TPA: hypothetical protein VGF20_00940, partial [Candidatus Acidoferrum sp.]
MAGRLSLFSVFQAKESDLMKHARIKTRRPFYLLRWLVCMVATLMAGGACRAQAVLQQPQGATPWEQELNKYPGLLPEAGQLIVKLQNNVHLPAARSESRLLPLLPESTVFYAAFPNYGDAAQQTLKTFRAELQESAVLRDWWLHGEVAATGPKVEDFVEKFGQFQGYLGDEIVLAGATDGREPSLLVIAEVRKPGLKGFLEQVIAQVAGNSKPGVRVLDPQQLAKLEDKGRGQEFMVLVRTDYVVGAADLKTLRSLNARLDQHSQGLASTAFGKRVVQEYSGGVVVLAAADLQSMLSLLPPVARGEQTPLYQSGFGDVQYLVWDRKSVGAESLSQSELTFIAPRHGAAAWLAKPAPLSTLDFVSPKPMMALTVSLIKPTKIFEDAKVLVGSANPNAFTSLEQFEKILKLSLKDDLLSYLTGELTLELDEINPPKMKWKAILKVNDAAHLQQTLNTLLATTHFETQHDESGAVAYNAVTIPSGATTTEIGYAFADGHLIVGSGREAVADAVELHRTGGSLGKSKALAAALPPGRTLEASAVLYQDPVAMSMLQMRRFAPQMSNSLSHLAGQGSPSVVGVYAEDTAIRENTDHR